MMHMPKIINKIKEWYRGEQMPPCRILFEGKYYEVERKQYFRPAIVRFLLVLKYLIFQEKAYQAKLKASLKYFGGAWLALLAFDLLKIMPTGTMPNATQWEVRKLGTILIFAAWLLSCLFLTYRFYNKNRLKGGISKKEFEKIQGP